VPGVTFIRDRSREMPDVVSLLPVPALLLGLTDGVILCANLPACSLLSLDSDALLGATLAQGCSPEDVLLLEQLYARLLAGPIDTQRRLTIEYSQERTGRFLRIELIAEPYPLENQPTALILLRDVTFETVTIEKAQLFSLTLSALQNAIAISDPQRPGSPLVYSNPEMDHLFGASAGQMIGKTLDSLVTNPADSVVLPLNQSSSWSVVRATRLNGTQFWDRIRSVALPGADGRVTHVLHVHEDLSRCEPRAVAAALMQTGQQPQEELLERRGFLTSLAGLLELAHINTASVAVMVIEISNLQQIFGLYSFDAADEMLKLLSQRLSTLIRQSDLLGGGASNQFLLACYSVDEERDVEAVAARLNEAISGAIQVCGEPFHVHSYIGVARFPEEGLSAEDLLRKASMAVQEGRTTHKDPVTMASPLIAARLTERHLIERELRKAIEEQQFVLHYQPQLQLSNGQLLGVEALLRWNHPTRGLLAPGFFIPIAEDTDLILPIGEWVMNTAFKMVTDFAKNGIHLGRIAVNVSQANLRRSRFIETVSKVLQASEIDPACIELEMTESLLVEDQDLFTRQIQNLKRLGLRIAIDDFGTRYTALDLLRHLPIDTLKIDRAFVHNTHKNKNDAAICRSLIALAASLNLNVVAEGVEDPGELAFLEKSGCHAAQGFLLGRPMPAEDLPAYLETLQGTPVSL